ncbi:MAG: biopolymer transporter ExbD [Daejeonella sp.]|nr:biopolymer transporter ExbD [Daejeonella sp.]
MAQLNTSESSKSSKKIRSKKMIVGVDLTAMVDLAFLLITFFMLTTSLAKQKAMDINMPVGDDTGTIPDNRSLTICLGSNNQVVWYRGTLDNTFEKPTKATYSGDGLRKILNSQSKLVLAMTNNPKKDIIVLIKPSDKSNYKNLVDVLDEMAISNVKQYSIADILPQEIDLLKKENLY